MGIGPATGYQRFFHGGGGCHPRRWLLALVTTISLLLLPGCGLWGYFSGEPDEPVDRPTNSETSRLGDSSDGIGVDDSLLDLEQFLLAKNPALELLREQNSEEESHRQPWVSGARVDDSAGLDRVLSAESSSFNERSLSIDWRPASLFEGEQRKQNSRSHRIVRDVRLRESESKMIRLLREEWSELWFLQRATDLTSSALLSLDREPAAKDDEAEQVTRSIQLASLTARWTDRLQGYQQEEIRTRTRINGLLGRNRGAILPTASEPGDSRFQDVDLFPERRMHPREILADQELTLASAQLDQQQGGSWPDLVLGARTSYDPDAPLTGSSGREESWTFTLGVEIPLGQQPANRQFAEAQHRLGVARARKLLARRAIEDEIAVARARLQTSLQTIRELEEEVIPHIQEAAAKLAAVTPGEGDGARLRIAEQRFDARINLLRAISHRARARVSLIDLLDLDPATAGQLFSGASNSGDRWLSGLDKSR